jgi:hypothetical protein
MKLINEISVKIKKLNFYQKDISSLQYEIIELINEFCYYIENELDTALDEIEDIETIIKARERIKELKDNIE